MTVQLPLDLLKSRFRNLKEHLSYEQTQYDNADSEHRKARLKSTISELSADLLELQLAIAILETVE